MKKIFIIAGMTGLGKTQVASKLANSLSHKRIIIGDSLQIYKNWPIATNHPSKSLQSEIQYDLLGLVDAKQEQLTTIEYRHKVLECLEKTFEQSNTAIIEGGSCFYLQYLLNARDEKYTKQQIQEAKQEYERLSKNKPLPDILMALCPSYDFKIFQNDRYRLQKAIIYAMLSNGDQFHAQNFEGPGLRGRYDVRGIFLYASTRYCQVLLDKRCSKMIEEGLIKEYLNYYTNGQSPTTQPIGHLEVCNFLNNLKSYIDKPNYKSQRERQQQLKEIIQTFIFKFQTKTRQYAGFQRKYFRNKMDGFKWVNINDQFDPLELLSLTRSKYDDVINSRANIQRQSEVESLQENRTIMSIPHQVNFEEILYQVENEILPIIRNTKILYNSQSYDQVQQMLHTS